jgi:WD40 repeat protein
MLFGETGGVIALYNGKTGHRFSVLRGHSSYINTLAFSLDGKYLASGSDDGTVIVWDMAGK